MQYFTVTIKLPKPTRFFTKVALVSVVLAVLVFGAWWTMVPGHFVNGMLVTSDSSPELRATTACLVTSPYVLNEVFGDPEIRDLPMLADICNPVEWGLTHIKVDYASHPNLIEVRIFCHPEDRDQTACLVSRIVEKTAECIDGDRVKTIKCADSGQITGYGNVGAFKKL